jgi:carbon storage regulator CsrA
MLVLSRHPNQSVHIRTPIGDEVIVWIIAVRGDKVRVGFESSPGHRIMRSEILDVNPHALETSAPAQ